MTNTLNRILQLKLVIAVSTVFIGFNCFAQTYSPQDFVKIPIPVAEGKEWFKYNQSALMPFEVAMVKGQLKISKWQYTPANVYRIPQGTLLAIDRGEFGGGLYYRPDDSTKTKFYVDGKPANANESLAFYHLFLNDRDEIRGKYLVIAGGHPKRFFAYRDSLYFIEGIDHMGFDHGTLCRLEFKGDSFRVVKIFSFDDAPHAVYVYADKILIATFRKFYVIENWHKQLIFDHLFWYGFNPNSIAVDDDENVYVGMFDFYAKIDLKNRNMELYKYNK